MSTNFNKDSLTRLKYWITERERCRANKEAGAPLPWTKDPIISKFRFCNVRRNDDRVTRWIHQNWLAANSGDPYLWFAMVVARLVNWPDTLSGLGKSVFNGSKGVRWRPDVFVSHMHWRKAEGEKVFSGAYIVSTNGHKMDKAEYLATRVLDPLWAERGAFKAFSTLAEFHHALQAFDGLGSFMAAQVIADIKYDKAGPLAEAEDWYTWAAPGPGSLRGMLRMLFGECDPDTMRLSELQWGRHFDDLFPLMAAKLPAGTLDSAQDLQNCLCEWDKYERVRLGQGTPRALYRSHE